MFWDSTYILVIIGALICAIASINVNATYRKYSRMMSERGLTARDCAEAILRSAGIDDVRIEHVGGRLTDHYSPSDGVAAQECGHAIQHQEDYAPLKLRTLSVPAANFGSFLSWPVIVIGLILGRPNIAQIGVVLFSLVVLFQLITLPVEFNASARALRGLEGQNLLAGNEMDGARKVLKAAALTYVAALFSSILQLLRLILITQGGGRRRD